jgi:hypothetical protein
MKAISIAGIPGLCLLGYELDRWRAMAMAAESFNPNGIDWILAVNLPPIILALGMLALAAALHIEARPSWMISLAYVVVGSAGLFYWSAAAGVEGLTKLGARPLGLSPMQTDPHGYRPMWNLSFTFLVALGVSGFLRRLRSRIFKLRSQVRGKLGADRIGNA